MKKKKLLAALAAAAVLAVGGGVLGGCGHEHTYSDKWESDATNHWHVATCDDLKEGDEDYKSDVAAHQYGDDNECDVCGYKKTTQTNPDPVEYTITLNAGEGTLSTTTLTTAGGKLTSLPTPTAPDGKKFDGWYTAATGGDKVTTATVFEANGTIYARYVDEEETGNNGSLIVRGSVEVVEEETTEFEVHYTGEGTLTYTIDDTDVATVEKNTDDQKKATITGVKEGTATLTVTDGTLTKTCTITVTGKPEVVTIYDGENEADEISLEREGTKQLTAETSKNSPVTWTSTNETVATIDENGNITAIRPGKTTIRASVNSASTADVTLTVTCKEDDPYYELKAADNNGTWNGTGFGGSKPDDTEFYYWANFVSGWVQGGIVDVKEAYYSYNTLVIEYSGVEVANAVQLHLKKNEAVTAGKYYLFSAKIYTDTAGCVNINGNVFNLKKGNNEVSFYFHPETEDEKLFYMVVGKSENASGSDIISGARLEIYDIEWTEDTDRETLVAPSFTIEDGVIKITDDTNNKDTVKEYRLGFFKDGKEVTSTVVTNGGEVDITVVDSGEYTVEIKAIGVDSHYIDSEYSATGTQLTVENEAGRSYTLKDNGEEDALATPGDWTYEKTEHIYQTEWVNRFDFNVKFENRVANMYFKNNEKAETLNMYYQPKDVTVGTVYKIEIAISVEDFNNQLWITSHGNNGDEGGTENSDMVQNATTAWITICGTAVEITVDGEAHTYTVYAKAVEGAPLVNILFNKDTTANYNRISRGAVHVADPTIKEITPDPLKEPTFEWDGTTNTITITGNTENEDGTVGKYVVGFFGEGDTDEPSYTIDVAAAGETVLDLSTVGEGTYTIKVKAAAANVSFIDSTYFVNNPADTITVQSFPLTAPTFELDTDAMTITISDENDSEVVAKYIVGLFEEGNEDPVATCNVYAKDKASIIYFLDIENGSYKIKVKAVGIGAMYPDSDWSEPSEAVNITAATEMTTGIEGTATGDADKWILYVNEASTLIEGVSTKGENLDTVIVIEYTGGTAFWTVQLFREIGTNQTGTWYTITFDLTVEFENKEITEAKIKVNGNDQTTIKAGEVNHITQSWNESGGASISIQLGTASPEKALPGRYIISNIKVVPMNS